MSLVAGIEPRLYPGADYFVSGQVLNPIYESREEEDKIHLHRRFVSDRISEMCRRYGAFLPESLEVTKEQIAERDPDLVRRFVLLDLPANYC